MRRSVMYVVFVLLGLVACGGSSSGTSASSSSSTSSSSSAASSSSSAASTSASTTASTAKVSIHDIDFTNRSYSGTLCAAFFDSPAQVPSSIDVHDGESAVLDDTLMVKLHVPAPDQFGDLNGDGDDDVIVTTDCSAGASGHDGHFLVFTAQEDDAVQIGALDQPADIASSGYFGYTKLVLHEGDVDVTWTVWQPDDPHCCPTKQQTYTYHWDGSTFAATAGPVVDLVNG